MQVVPSDENDHTGSFSSFTPCGAPSGIRDFWGPRKVVKTLWGKEGTPQRLRAARSAAKGMPSVAEVVSDARRATKGAAFGFRKPFEKGLTENFANLW